jgi:hypothetical protein
MLVNIESGDNGTSRFVLLSLLDDADDNRNATTVRIPVTTLIINTGDDENIANNQPSSSKMLVINSLKDETAVEEFMIDCRYGCFC